MSILQADIPGARVVDLFAGSGALGLEALSRGAASADFVEKSAPSLRSLQANIEKLSASGAAVIHRADALKFAERLDAGAYDIAFADPPYTGGSAARLAGQWLRIPFATVFSVEHASSEAMPANGETRRYGSTAITVYRSED